jgi:diguanylate cyclase (GGDEF)-like protein
MAVSLALLALPLLPEQTAAGGSGGATTPNQPLRTGLAVHLLTPDEAAQARPVVIRGEVTFYDPRIRSLFVHDATGGIYIFMPAGQVLPLAEGMRVEVIGVSSPGDFAPIVVEQALHVLGGTRSLPKSASLTRIQLESGHYDCASVRIEGLVHSIDSDGAFHRLRVMTSTGIIIVMIPEHSAESLDRYLSAQVSVHGVAAVDYNKRQQMTGVHLFTQSLDDINILTPSPGDGNELPVQSISSLAKYDVKAKSQDRIHIRGRVTLEWPGHLICVQDDSDGLCVENARSFVFPVGSVVDVVGFPKFGAAIPALSDVTLRLANQPAATPTVLQLTAADALKGTGSGWLVAVDGELIGVSSNTQERQLTILSDGVVFSAVVPLDGSVQDPVRWNVGSLIRVTGVRIDEVDPQDQGKWTSEQRIKSFRILMRSSGDVKLVRLPPWWNPTHAFAVVGVGALVTLGVLGWGILLRRKVDERTRELRSSEERYKNLAEHDPLTGAPNRALFRDRMGMALERAKRQGLRVGLLLLDLDRFKPINDELGHEAGDRVLCALVDRASGAVRKSDTVARLGGDEFAVLVPDMESPDEAMLVAEKILQAVCRPLTVEKREVAVSTSLGVAVYPDDGLSLEELLRKADAAMYEAKRKSGRRARGDLRRNESEPAVDQPIEDETEAFAVLSRK